MLVTKATYGDVDCTKEIQNRIESQGDSICIRADNSIIGDPKVGAKKQLIIEINNIAYYTDEGSFFVYPKTKKNKLGVWYTNNAGLKNQNAIKKSLDTIYIASKDKADIITCVWNKIEGNKFIELTSWYKQSTHLNQLLQILQCLSLAKQIGNYEYVSFLEHDVMYPEGYFDFPNFDNGTILTNMNYGGINIYGWQNKTQQDEPMHQMTMKFDDAINHLKNILENALVTNSGNIEDQKLVRKKWQCEHQSIHINHGNHFTSHYSIYEKNKNLPKQHNYWGSHEEYLYLLN